MPRSTARYITPDVIVQEAQGQLDGLHQIRMPTRACASTACMPRSCAKQRRGNGNLTTQMQEARWLIKNVQRRFDTIHACHRRPLLTRQRQFFEHGEVAMRPLVLREIADILDLHESTVSRVTSQKYMATPRRHL